MVVDDGYTSTDIGQIGYSARSSYPTVLFGPDSRLCLRTLVYLLCTGCERVFFTSGLDLEWFGSSTGSSDFTRIQVLTERGVNEVTIVSHSFMYVKPVPAMSKKTFGDKKGSTKDISRGVYKNEGNRLRATLYRGA